VSESTSNVSRILTFFLIIFVLSVPLQLLGLLTTVQLLPGLPLSALVFLVIALVACLFAYRSGGFSGLGALLARIGDFRRTRPWTWHLVNALLMPAVLLSEYAIMKAAHAPLHAPQIAWLDTPALLVAFFFAAACEEIAWSGTALDPLQERYGALVAALFIGVFWAALHVIPYAQGHPSVVWVAGQCAFSVMFRVVLVWIYNVTGRSVFAAIVCHASYNTAWQLFPNHGSAYNPWLASGLTGLVALGVILAFGSRTLAEWHLTSRSS